ncbi:hypothetical protein [Bradyrhizobium sp. NBAIM01]|uniref:hypothetical protein n=1 Tax=Bradyrhizobium sp. NBAIM01 TaxID=2793818 RepID=UPI001CD6E441|nr:hypothetical protein [Bradyrhizobium sp. NBAIM01]MCA1510508.1 hypothetical protein [Bradyrhizobium sp. NBAIM01]
MVTALRNTVMAVAFIAVATVSILWDLNSYVACGLALVASFASGYCVERAFINRSHCDMIRLKGADWRSAEDP